MIDNNKAIKTKYDLSFMIRELEKSKNLSADSLNADKTVLIVVDMVNGFAVKGSLADKRINKIVRPIAELCKKLSKLGIKQIALADCHTMESTELTHFPIHCIKGSYEAKVTDEILNSAELLIIEKNSTNGFFSDDFQKFLFNNKNIDTFIIVGCCTDICVFQLATTLKAYFNSKNKASNIYVAKSLCETYDTELHNGDLLSITSLYNMKINGIEIVNKIV